MARPQPTPTPTQVPFGERKGLEGLIENGSWLRQLGTLAGDAFVSAMRDVCPTNPEAAFEQLLKRKSFRLRWLPEEMRDGLSKEAVQTAMLETPLVEGLVDTYHKLTGFMVKRQHLSLIAPHLPYDTVRKLFGISRCAHSKIRTGWGGYRFPGCSWLRRSPNVIPPLLPLPAGLVYAACLHAAGVGTDRPVPPRVTSYRIKPEQAAELNAFTARPEMTQTLASSGGKKGATTELRLKPAVLLRKYKEAVPEHLQVSSHRPV